MSAERRLSVRLFFIRGPAHRQVQGLRSMDQGIHGPREVTGPSSDHAARRNMTMRSSQRRRDRPWIAGRVQTRPGMRSPGLMSTSRGRNPGEEGRLFQGGNSATGIGSTAFRTSSRDCTCSLEPCRPLGFGNQPCSMTWKPRPGLLIDLHGLAIEIRGVSVVGDRFRCLEREDPRLVRGIERSERSSSNMRYSRRKGLKETAEQECQLDPSPGARPVEHPVPAPGQM